MYLFIYKYTLCATWFLGKNHLWPVCPERRNNIKGTYVRYTYVHIYRNTKRSLRVYVYVCVQRPLCARRRTLFSKRKRCMKCVCARMCVSVYCGDFIHQKWNKKFRSWSKALNREQRVDASVSSTGVLQSTTRYDLCGIHTNVHLLLLFFLAVVTNFTIYPTTCFVFYQNLKHKITLKP